MVERVDDDDGAGAKGRHASAYTKGDDDRTRCEIVAKRMRGKEWAAGDE